MLTSLKLVKINILSLISFPLLLISITSKLLLKALEKALVFLGVGVALLGLFLLNLIFNNPNSLLNGISTLIVLIILFGVIILITFSVLILLGSIATAIFSMIISALMTILNFIFHISNNGYSKLYDICKKEHDSLVGELKDKRLSYICVLWHMLKYFNWIVVKLLSIAYPISIATSIGLVFYCIISVKTTISKTFGIGIFSYLKLFPTTNTVFTVLYFMLIVISCVIVLISLGIEWGEWGQLLKISTQNYQDYRNTMLQKTLEFSSDVSAQYIFEQGKNSQHCQQYMETLLELFGNVEAFQHQIDTAMHLKYDPSIVCEFTEYINTLNLLSEMLSDNKSVIACKNFQHQFIPLIDKANKQSKDIQKRVLKVIENSNFTPSNEENPADFFGGCVTEEDIKKRYKSLCKIYHPDLGGHEDTFKLLQNQYKTKVVEVTSSS